MDNNPTITTIMNRRSARRYDSRAIEDDKLRTILRCGQSAPYVEEDSRRFAVIRDAATINTLKAAATLWAAGSDLPHLAALARDPQFDCAYGAPVVMVVSANTQSIKSEMVCAASVQNMLLAACSVGVSSCWAHFPIFAFNGEQSGALRRMLHIPDQYEPCASILLGYGEIPDVSQDARYKNEIVFI